MASEADVNSVLNSHWVMAKWLMWCVFLATPMNTLWLVRVRANSALEGLAMKLRASELRRLGHRT